MTAFSVNLKANLPLHILLPLNGRRKRCSGLHSFLLCGDNENCPKFYFFREMSYILPTYPLPWEKDKIQLFQNMVMLLHIILKGMTHAGGIGGVCMVANILPTEDSLGRGN